MKSRYHTPPQQPTKAPTHNYAMCPRRLTVLDACSGASGTIRSLQLAGVIPHSTTLSAAVAAALPHLARIKLQYVSAVRYGPEADEDVMDFLPYAEDEEEVREGYCMAVAALLSLVGPRLRALEATGSAHFWPPECFAALQQCTALTSLQLEAGRKVLHCESYRDLCLGTWGSVGFVLGLRLGRSWQEVDKCRCACDLTMKRGLWRGCAAGRTVQGGAGSGHVPPAPLWDTLSVAGRHRSPVDYF